MKTRVFALLVAGVWIIATTSLRTAVATTLLAETNGTFIVNRTPAGATGNGHSFDGAITPDGRYIAFRSFASDLVPGDTNGVADIFVHDQVLRTMERVSLASDGSQITTDPIYHRAETQAPSISDDGRFVTFTSDAAGLGPGQQFSNTLFPQPHVYLHDRQTHQTNRLGIGFLGVAVRSSSAKISGSGNVVAICTLDALLPVPLIQVNAKHLWVYDRPSATFELVSKSTNGAIESGTTGCDYGGYAITPNGQQIAFLSNATDLVVPNDTTGSTDVFVRDRTTGTTSRVSVGPGGVEAIGESFGVPFCCPNRAPSITADGRYVSFISTATNLVSTSYSQTAYGHVFVHDRQTGVTSSSPTLSATAPVGGFSNGDYAAALTRDGRYLAIVTNAQLTAEDLDASPDLYLYDRVSGVTHRAKTLVTSIYGISGDAKWIVVGDLSDQVVAVDSGIVPPLNKVTPTITWSQPSDLLYGIALSAAQLNATATVPGLFVYAPEAGTILPPGSTLLTATFTPDDQDTYTQAVATRSINITPVPPTLVVPPNLTVEATGPGGATVSFTASAIDALGAALAVTCTPATGSMFPLGTTLVACTAVDAHGNPPATASLSVTVRDTTPPTLTLPSTMAVDATGVAGAVVTFAATAVDIVDGVRPVTCLPASGATFPVGTTTISCTTADSRGNATAGTFDVTVGGAFQIVTNLAQQLGSFQQGQNLLANVLKSITAGQLSIACGQLSSFIAQVQAQSGKQLTAAQAVAFITSARSAMAALGCS